MIVFLFIQFSHSKCPFFESSLWTATLTAGQRWDSTEFWTAIVVNLHGKRSNDNLRKPCHSRMASALLFVGRFEYSYIMHSPAVMLAPRGNHWGLPNSRAHNRNSEHPKRLENPNEFLINRCLRTSKAVANILMNAFLHKTIPIQFILVCK